MAGSVVTGDPVGVSVVLRMMAVGVGRDLREILWGIT